MLRIILGILLLPVVCQSATLVDLDFNSGSWSPLSKQSWWSYIPNEGVDGTGCMRLFITHQEPTGTANRALIFNADPYNTDDYWVEFDTKVSSHATGGSKFVKFFGKDPAGSTAQKNNMTVGLQYTSMLQQRVAYYGDTLCADTWDGPIAYPSSDCIPHSTYNTTTATGGSIDIRGSAYHHIKMHVKRADSGTRNGTTTIWHNGTLVGDVSNQNTNPPSYNSTEFYEITFGSYTDPSNFTGADWYLWIDNLYIGTTEKNATPPPGPVLSNPIPTTPLPAGTVSTTLGITTSVSATCKYSFSPGTPYPDMDYFTTGAGTTTHTSTINNLIPGQNVPYYIRCAKTSDGEQNDTDYQINIAVANSYQLSVTKFGTGTGTVTGPGITCGTDCTEVYGAGTSVPLTNTPGSNSVLGDVTGEDSTNGSTSTVVMNSSRAVNVEFIDTSPVACSLTNYWACDQPSCGALGLYYRNWACRTTPPPTDITGANLVNGTFTTWSGGLPVGWFSAVSAYVQNSYNGVGLLAGAQNMAQIYTALPAPGTYRYEINVRSITSGGELTQRTGSDEETNGVPVVHTTAGTKTGLVTVTEDALNLYFELGSGAARTAVLDDFTLHLYSGPESDTPKESLHGGLLTGGSLSQ